MPELMKLSGRPNRAKYRDRVVRPILDAGLAEMTIPDKPRSFPEQYLTTPADLRVLEEEV